MKKAQINPHTNTQRIHKIDFQLTVEKMSFRLWEREMMCTIRKQGKKRCDFFGKW